MRYVTDEYDEYMRCNLRRVYEVVTYDEYMR